MSKSPDAAGHSDKARTRALAEALHAALCPFDTEPEIQKRVLSAILAAKAVGSDESLSALETRLRNAYYIAVPGDT